MREDVKNFMEFINATVEKNAKCGYDTYVKIQYNFFGGEVAMKLPAHNVEFYNDAIQFVSDERDESDFVLTVKTTSAIRISIDRMERTFAITNIGVTGIMDDRIGGQLTTW